MLYRLPQLAVLLLMTLSSLARADDNAALYDDALPADAGFVRLLNLAAAPAELRVPAHALSQAVGGTQLGDFLVLREGEYEVTVNGDALTVAIGAGQATTLISDGQQLRQQQAPLPQNPRKAQIWFYNFSTQPLALKTADGQIAVVDTLAPGAQGERLINEVKLGFAAFQGQQAVAEFAPLLLRKGRSYSYLVMATEQGPVAQAKLNTVARRDP